MEKIEEFLEDMRMEGKAEGTLREYKRLSSPYTEAY